MDPLTLIALIPGMPPGASSITSQNVANWGCGNIGLGIVVGLIVAALLAGGLERWYRFVTGRNRKGR